MKKTLFLLVSVLSFGAAAQTPDLDWVKTFGGTGEDYSLSVKADNGNIYHVGHFTETSDFDPGAGVTNLVSSGAEDIYVTKLDASGNLIWARSMGGALTDVGFDIFIDGNGNCYTTGYFNGSVDFDPGPGIHNLTSAGATDVFISKLDASGNFVWAKRFGGTTNDAAYHIETDNTGNLILTGYFMGTADFDPGTGTQNLTAAGSTDIFVCRFDLNGNLLIVKQIGGAGSDIPGKIKCDAGGSIYLTGQFEGVVDFDPGAGTQNLTSVGNFDVFILKLTAAGNLAWVKQVGGIDNDYGRSISIDASGNSYCAGHFALTTDFDPGAGIQNLNSTGIFDAFILKLDASGNFTWVKQITGTEWELVYDMESDALGNTYTAGVFSSPTTDFDPGAGTFNVAAASANMDAYILKLDASGNFQWAQTFGAIGTEYIQSIALTGASLITLGTFNTPQDLNPGAGVNNHTPSGATDIFLQKFSLCSPTTSTVSASNCNSYTWHGTTYTTSGSYTWVGTNSAGCDSTVTLNLTITQPTTSTISETECGSYTWHGTTYTTSGAYTWVGTNAAGCDSTATLNLTITQPTTSTISETECGSYTWHGTTYTTSGAYTWVGTNAAGCDSTATLNLTITQPTTSTISETECGSYTWHGTTYTTSGAYTWVGTNAAGCDSTVTLNLTITQPATSTISETECGSYTWHGTTYNTSGAYTWVGTNAAGCDSTVTLNLTINNVNTSTSVTGITISSNANGAAYKWLNCNNGMSIIPNQTAQTFTPTANGSYAVEVTQNGCTDTSACISVTSVGLDENSTDKIRLYPNPTSSKFTLEFDSEQSIVSIYSLTGQLIESRKTADQHSITFELDQPNGVYFVEVLNRQEQKVMLKVVKE